MHSLTRRAFLAKKKARKQQRAEDAYARAHTTICQGRRRRHGKENQLCEWPLQFGKIYDGASIRCRRCGQLNRSYGDKWFKAEEYEIGKYDIPKAERQAQEGDYKHEPWYTPGERPNREPDCGHKDFDLIGLHRVERKTVGGPGVIKIGIAMVDRFNVVRHWCRPAKS